MTPTPASTDQKIWAIAWPMMLSSMSVPMLGLVDTALLGHLEGARFLGAVAIGANFIGLMYWSFGFLRMGTTSLTAQQRGADSSSNALTSTNIDAILFRALVIALALGALVALAIPLVIDHILTWMQASAEVAPLAAEYIDIRRYSAPAVFMTFAVHGYLVGIQKPRGALVLVLVTNLTNIVLDVWFIVYLGWETAGAAWATLIAEWLGLAIGLLMVMRYSGAMQPGRWRAWFSITAFAHMLSFNYHLLIRTILLLFVFNFFT
ncbi:MAG: MATE family efflux transporter, partial [Pseudomonadales bacterium]